MAAAAPTRPCATQSDDVPPDGGQCSSAHTPATPYRSNRRARFSPDQPTARVPGSDIGGCNETEFARFLTASTRTALNAVPFLDDRSAPPGVILIAGARCTSFDGRSEAVHHRDGIGVLDWFVAASGFCESTSGQRRHLRQIRCLIALSYPERTSALRCRLVADASERSGPVPGPARGDAGGAVGLVRYPVRPIGVAASAAAGIQERRSRGRRWPGVLMGPGRRFLLRHDRSVTGCSGL